LSHFKERSEKICLNCNAELHGLYCHVCGQENIEPKQSAWHLVTHFFYDITHFDGKFFTTLKDLLIRPGFLSREYIAGRRVSYLHPIRMYIFTSAIFFIIFFSIYDVKRLTESSNIKVNVKGMDDAKRQALSNAKSKEDSLAIEKAFSSVQNLPAAFAKDSPLTKKTEDPVVAIGGSGRQYKSLQQYDSVQKGLPPNLRDGWFAKLIMHKQIEINIKYKDNRKGFLQDWITTFFHSFPKLLFISLPIFALSLRLIYVRRKEFYYADHGIFTIHIYIYSFIALLFVFGISYLGRLTNWPFLWLPNVAIMIYSLYYFYKAMRIFYRQGRMKRIIGTVMIAGSRAAFSSAFIMRSSRNSAASTRSEWASGVP